MMNFTIARRGAVMRQLVLFSTAASSFLASSRLSEPRSGFQGTDVLRQLGNRRLLDQLNLRAENNDPSVAFCRSARSAAASSCPPEEPFGPGLVTLCSML